VVIVKILSVFSPFHFNDPNMLSSRAFLIGTRLAAQVPDLEAIGDVSGAVRGK